MLDWPGRKSRGRQNVERKVYVLILLDLIGHMAYKVASLGKSAANIDGVYRRTGCAWDA